MKCAGRPFFGVDRKLSQIVASAGQWVKATSSVSAGSSSSHGVTRAAVIRRSEGSHRRGAVILRLGAGGMRHFLKSFRIRVASRCASRIASAGDFDPVSAACRPLLSAVVTRWLSWVESSATEYCSWSRATSACGTSCAYFFISGVSQAAGVTAT